MKALITVGTTEFPRLINEISGNLNALYQILEEYGFTHLTLQYGQSRLPEQLEKHDSYGTLEFEWKQYIPDLSQLIQEFHLVISHGGAGTLLECIQSHPIRRAKVKPNNKSRQSSWSGFYLVIVPNEDLMDNHQLELSHEVALRYPSWSRLIRLPPHDADDMKFAVSSGSFIQQFRNCLNDLSKSYQLIESSQHDVGFNSGTGEPSKLRQLITALFQ